MYSDFKFKKQFDKIFQKLKTSEHLERRMKEIAEVYVTPAIMAVDMRKKRETKSTKSTSKAE